MDSMNIHEERSLLPPESLALWRGLPIGYWSASPEILKRNVTFEHPILAMLDAGRAQAEFGYFGRTEHRDIGEGAIGLFNGLMDQRFSKWRCQSVRRVMLNLDPATIAGSGLLCDELEEITWIQNTEIYDQDVTRLLRSMLAEIGAGCPNGALYAQSLSIGLLLHMARLYRAPAGARRENGRFSGKQYKSIEEFVRGNLSSDLSLATLAKAIGFSPAQFSRLFSNTFGISPHRYVLARRIEKARELIEAGELPLAVVSCACGFSSQSHMTNVFKRVQGISPGAVQRLRPASPADAGLRALN